jgi:hypothetical protein
MLRLDARLATVLSATLGFALSTACSAAPDPGGETLARGDDDTITSDKAPAKSTTSGAPNNTGGAPSGTTPPATNTTPPPDGTPAPVPAGDCSAEQSFDGCMTCCVGGNKAAWDQAEQVFSQCDQQQCATPCKNEQSAECGQCLDTCSQQADQACQQDAACAPILQCLVTSSCDQKN